MFYIPVVIYVPAMAFGQMSGLDVFMIAYVACAVCIFYTCLVSFEMSKQLRGLFILNVVTINRED